MIERPDVDALLAGPLGDWLDEQAIVREDAKRIAATRWWNAALIGVPVIAFLWIAIPGLFQLKFFLAAIIGGGGFAWGNAPRRKAVRTVKEGINGAIAGAVALDYLHDCEPDRAFESAQKYALVPRYDRSKFEDRWSGDIGHRAFRLYEAHLRQRRNSGKRTRYVTVFRGAVMRIDFSRDFHATTLLERAARHRSFLGGRKDSIDFDGHRLDYVDMVHPQFEDAFALWSDDQVEARYLVHPEYVERLIEVREAFGGKNIRALFTGGDLVIVVETENMFESGSIDAADDRSRIARTIEQFASLADLVQSLNEPERGPRQLSRSRKSS